MQLFRVPRIDGHQAWPAGEAEAAGIAAVDNGAAGEDHDAAGFGYRHRQLTPMHGIARDRVAPAHMPPFVAERVELKK